jgi:hypothetical protein
MSIAHSLILRGLAMMFEDDVHEGGASEPETALSAFELEEITLIKRMMALPDDRPDPGIYRNAESDGAARDLVELAMMISFADARELATPWRPYLQPEDLFDDPSAAQ